MTITRFLKSLVVAAVLLWAVPAWAAIVVTNIGTAGTYPISSLTITVGVGGVPAGSLIVLFADEQRASYVVTHGTVVDTKSNVYNYLPSIENDVIDGGNGAGFGSIVYAYNSIALVSGDTITYTAGGSGDLAISAYYATGIQTASDPLDATVTATRTGNLNGINPTLTLTSGTPSTGGELFAGFISSFALGTYTQDTTHGWSAPLNLATSNSNAFVAGGHLVNAGTGTKIFSPTATGNYAYAMWIIGFKPAPPSSTFLFHPFP